MFVILRKRIPLLIHQSSNQLSKPKLCRLVWHAGYLNAEEADEVGEEIEAANKSLKELKRKLHETETKLRELNSKYKDITGESYIATGSPHDAKHLKLK